MGQAASYAGDDEQQAAADCFEHEEGEYSKPGDLASATLRVDRIELLLTQASSHRCFLKKLSKEEKKQYIMLRCCCGWESSKYKERTREATMRVTQDHQNHTREVKERQCDWNAAKRLLKLLKEATTLIGDSGHADVGVAKREFLARAMAGEAKHLWKRRTGSADAGSPLLIAVAKGCLHFMMAYATLSSKERAAMERIVMLSHRTGRVPPLTAAHSAVMRDVAEPLPATQAAQDVSLALQESGCEALQVCEGYAAEAYEGVSEGSSDSDEDETDVADDELSSLEELGKRSDPDVHRKYAADAPLRAAVDSLASFGNYEHAKLPNRGAKKRRMEEAASAPGQERLVTSAPPQKRNARRVNDPPLKKARPAAPLPQPARATVDAAHAMHSPSPAEAIGCVESTE